MRRRARKRSLNIPAADARILLGPQFESRTIRSARRGAIDAKRKHPRLKDPFWIKDVEGRSESGHNRVSGIKIEDLQAARALAVPVGDICLIKLGTSPITRRAANRVRTAIILENCNLTTGGAKTDTCPPLV